jgi:hypothetical protein
MIVTLVGGPLDGLQLDQPPDSSSVTCALPHRFATYLRHSDYAFRYEVPSAPRTAPSAPPTAPPAPRTPRP